MDLRELLPFSACPSDLVTNVEASIAPKSLVLIVCLFAMALNVFKFFINPSDVGVATVSSSAGSFFAAFGLLNAWMQ